MEQAPWCSLWVGATPSVHGLEHGGATWQQGISVQIHAELNVTLHEVLERSVVDSLASLPMTLGWKNTRATETLSTDSDDVSV